MHSCTICNKEFKYKYLLQRHTNNIRICKKNNDTKINYDLLNNNYKLQLTNMNDIIKKMN